MKHLSLVVTVITNIMFTIFAAKTTGLTQVTFAS